ncbi:hypothetical protein THOB06_140039 [Vibrio rotiferianus]|nr:hypothetical protein THOG10_140040 [Vibrio rotiferianus]CAH1564807.1 hypothetical protein THOB06_140039 [Vibrio rotiferianus]
MCNKCNFNSWLLSKVRSLPLVIINLTDSVNVIFLVKFYWSFNKWKRLLTQTLQS